MDAKTKIVLGDPAPFPPAVLRERRLDRWRRAATCSKVGNPATGEIIGTVPALGAEETHGAIEAADAAWPAWRSRPAKERANLMRRWFDLMMAHQEDLAVADDERAGQAAGRVARRDRLRGVLRRMVRRRKEARLRGRHRPPAARQADRGAERSRSASSPRSPRGTSPAAMITRKCAPALAAGCPVVIRPASQTPFSALALAALAERAGIPPGVDQRRHRPVGPMGPSSPRTRRCASSRSPALRRSAKLLMSQCASTVKKVSLELGGNAPFIVFDDADLDAAVAGAMASKYPQRGADLRMRQPVAGPGRDPRRVRREDESRRSRGSRSATG